MTPKRIVIFGSSRPHGNTRQIVDEFIRLTGADLINLNDYSISYYDYEHRNQDDDFIKLFERLLNYDQLVFATPIYWYAMSAIMKTFFDRITDVTTFRKELGRQLRGKHLAVISCSSDEEQYAGFEMPFKNSADYLNMHFDGYVHTWLEDGGIPDIVNDSLKQLANKKLS